MPRINRDGDFDPCFSVLLLTDFKSVVRALQHGEWPPEPTGMLARFLTCGLFSQGSVPRILNPDLSRLVREPFMGLGLRISNPWYSLAPWLAYHFRGQDFVERDKSGLHRKAPISISPGVYEWSC